MHKKWLRVELTNLYLRRKKGKDTKERRCYDILNYQEEDIVIEYYNNGKLESSAEAAKIDSVKLLEKSHLAAMNMVIRTEKAHVLRPFQVLCKHKKLI